MINYRTTYQPIITKTTSLIVGLIGIIVILGWFLKSKETVQILPNLVPMQFNTALCFFLSGIALHSYSKNKLISNLCSMIIASLSLMTLFEYLFHINLVVDDLFIEPFIATKTSHPGRMAPNTALSFLCFSLFIFLNQSKSNRFWYIIAIFPCVYGILGSISLMGYLFHIEQAYAWGALTHMALHTSIAFILLSIGSLTLFFFCRKLTALQQETVYDVSIFTFVLFFCFIIWLSLRANIVNQLKEDIDSSSLTLSSKLTIKLESEIEALIRIFARINDNSYSNSTAVKKDVHYYFKHMPFLDSIYVKFSKTNKEDLYTNPRSNKNIAHTINAQCQSLSTAPTENGMLSIDKIHRGDINYFCIQKNGMIAVINLSGLLSEYVFNESKDFNISIFEKNKEKLIAQSHPKNEAFIKFWAKKHGVKIYSKEYYVKITPKEQYIKEYLGKFPYYALVMSILLSTLALLIAKNKRQLVKKDIALRHSKNINYTLLNAVGESIIGIDQEYYVNFMNQSSQKLLQFSYAPDSRLLLKDILISEEKTNPLPALHYVKLSMNQSRIIKNNIIYIVDQQSRVIPVSLSISPIIENNLVKGAIIVLFDISDRVKYEENLKELAYVDSLTNIPNRYSLLNKIEAIINSPHKSSFALCFIDVNKFKLINDKYGHIVGDKALQFVAEKMSGNIRKDDFLARLAGDEFCIILNGVENTQLADVIIEKLKLSLQEPFIYNGVNLFIDVSIGYALYSDELSAEELLTLADHAMYQNKASHK